MASFQRKAMKVEFTMFVDSKNTEADVRAFVDEVVHHAWGSPMAERIGDFVFHQPTVRVINKD